MHICFVYGVENDFIINFRNIIPKILSKLKFNSGFCFTKFHIECIKKMFKLKIKLDFYRKYGMAGNLMNHQLESE